MESIGVAAGDGPSGEGLGLRRRWAHLMSKRACVDPRDRSGTASHGTFTMGSNLFTLCPYTLATLRNPTCSSLDESTSSLDPSATKRIEEPLRARRAGDGRDRDPQHAAGASRVRLLCLPLVEMRTELDASSRWASASAVFGSPSDADLRRRRFGWSTVSPSPGWGSRLYRVDIRFSRADGALQRRARAFTEDVLIPLEDQSGERRSDRRERRACEGGCAGKPGSPSIRRRAAPRTLRVRSCMPSLDGSPGPLNTKKACTARTEQSDSPWMTNPRRASVSARVVSARS